MCVSRWPSLSSRCTLSSIGWARVSIRSWFLNIQTGLHTSNWETGSRRHARVHASLFLFSPDPLKGKQGTLKQLCWLEDRQQSHTLPRLTTSWQPQRVFYLKCYTDEIVTCVGPLGSPSLLSMTFWRLIQFVAFTNTLTFIPEVMFMAGTGQSLFSYHYWSTTGLFPGLGSHL